MIRAPRKINVKDATLSRVQEGILLAIQQISASPIIDGELITEITIGTASTPVPHKLGRLPLGYIVVEKDGPGDVHLVSKDQNFLYLVSSATLTANLWVF